MRSLTDQQLEGIDVLVSARRIEKVLPDQKRSKAFLNAAHERLSQLPLLTSPAVIYDIAYDAAHDVGEAVLAAYGYRTTNRLGQHEALGRFLCAVFDAPPGHSAARRYDRLRRARNQNRYDAAVVGQAEAKFASDTAQALYTAAVERDIGEF